MRSIKIFLNEVLYSGKFNYHYVVIYYWCNVKKELKPVPYNRYLNATKDYFGFTWLNEEGKDITIPYHRILRVTDLTTTGIVSGREVTIWERTDRLNKLMSEIPTRKKVAVYASGSGNSYFN